MKPSMRGAAGLLRVAGLGLLVLLAGCEAAEDSAQKLAEQARQELEEAARDTLEGASRELNERIDQAQESSRAWLEGEREQGDRDAPRPPDEAEQGELESSERRQT